MAGVDDADEVGAIDGQGNSFAKFGGAEPALFVLGESGSGNQVEPHKLGIKAGTGVMSGSRRFFFKTVEKIGIERIDEMDFAATEAKNLAVVSALNAEATGIEVT